MMSCLVNASSVIRSLQLFSFMLNCWTASYENTLPLVLMATMWENCTQPVAIHVNASASGHGRIGSVHPCCTGTFPRYTTYSYTRIGSDRGSPQSVRGSPQIHNISAEFMNKHCCKSAHLVENFLHDWTLVLPLTILVEGEWNQLLEFERFACHRACMMLVEVGHNIRYVKHCTIRITNRIFERCECQCTTVEWQSFQAYRPLLLEACTLKRISFCGSLCSNLTNYSQ